jgi:8-oxo-dGTP diphosphatase
VRTSVGVVHGLVERLRPFDGVEAGHRAEALRWLESTDDVFRRVKPATPDRHLVSYVVLADRADGSTLLVDHINAGLWLPPGGHVEPDEHPGETARREAEEELGIDLAEPVLPSFITVTRTVGQDHGHVDVSLWFMFDVRRDTPITPNPTEFRAVRWWTPADVRATAADRFDPHYRRFLAKAGF